MFDTQCNAEDLEKLTVRFKNGLGSSKYKPVEYKKLQSLVDAKRLESALIGQKVQRLRCGAKATKESSILRQHRQVWSRDCPRLQKAEEKAENEMRDFLEPIRPNSTIDNIISSLQDYELFLDAERAEFRVATVEPVYELREDLRFRLTEMRHQHTDGPPLQWEDVQQQIHFVKDQQDRITAKLQAERATLEDDVTALDVEQYLVSDQLPAAESVPEEVLESDCPFPELKISLIEAFQALSERYQSRLQNLQAQLQRIDKSCGWNADDHLRFQFVLSQYTHDIPDHRALCMDMLQRLFPQKTRQELSEHEREWDGQRFTQAQMSAVTQQWQRDQEDLLAKALVTLQEARIAHQEELELHRDRRHQQDICSHLKNKLQQWRAQQEEVSKLEAAIAARHEVEKDTMLRREQEKEAALRSQQKEKLRQFQLKQQRRREEVELRDHERLANLRSHIEEQARRDKERVQFRADMLQRRKEEREAREMERQRDEEERQNNLEALRKQVEVVAEADPQRMMADTQSWKSRQKSQLEKPLYSLNTYTDEQILSDPRLRIEQALRDAGLQRSEYAKQVLSVIQPPKPPRRDTESLLKF